MGFENRDWLRDRQQGGWNARRSGGSRGSFLDWEVWKKLIAINIGVFLLQIFFTRPATEEDLRRSPYYDPEMYAYDIVAYEDAYELARGQERQEELKTSGEQSSEKAAKKTTAAENSDATDRQQENATADVPLEKPGDAAVDQPKKEHADEYDDERYGFDRLTPQQRAMALSYLPRISIVQEWLELDSQKVKEGQIWRLVTAGFCHDRMGIWHLLFNMLFLFWFGRRLESMYGAAEFTAFYFSSLLVSSFAYIALDLYTQTMIPAIGASGAVWGVTALYALHYPYERIYIYLLFPVEIRWLVLLYFIFDLHPILLALSGDRYFSGVAHAAHVGGAIFGFLYWKQNWRLMPIIDWFGREYSSRTPRASGGKSGEGKGEPENLKIYSEQSGPTSGEQIESGLTAKMDAILDKISREGHESLTDDELETLEESSRHIRNQRQKRGS